jgi:polar amino acid transport system substrate-binding protein
VQSETTAQPGSTSPAGASAPGADLLDEVRKRRCLLLGVTDSSPPFSFRQPHESKSVGYDVELAEKVATRLGLTVEQMTLRNQDRIPFLQDGKVDLVAVGMSITPERAKHIDFSYAYLDSPHQIVVRRDRGLHSLRQFAGRKLALNKGASVEPEIRSVVPSVEFVHFDNYDACFAAVKDARADGFLSDRLLLLTLANREARPDDYMLLPDYVGPRTCGFGLPKRQGRFKDAVNQALLDLETSGDAQKVFARWFPGTERTFRIAPDADATADTAGAQKGA